MLSVILPVFNESENLPRVESELIPVLDSLNTEWEIVVINDGSTDSSQAILSSLCEKEPRIRVTDHKKNKGLGAAVRTGIAKSKGNWILTLDADFTFHPKYIATLWEASQKEPIDVVIGSPFFEGATLDEIPWYRAILTKTCNGLYRIALGVNAHSITPIFRLYQRKLFHNLKLRSNGFPINAEILVSVMQNGAKIREIPVPLKGRSLGRSKVRFLKETVRHLTLIAYLFVKRILKLMKLY